MIVQLAHQTHLGQVKRLADSEKATFGFITRGSLAESQQRGELLIAIEGDEVRGFARFHHRRDRQTTLYDICVAPAHRRGGIGSELLSELLNRCIVEGQSRLLLKCPEDSPANAFYLARLFQMMGTQPGRKRPLTLWTYDL